jgi:hypothetical protein
MVVYYKKLQKIVFSGRRETRTLTISRHILSVVRLPIPPLALFRVTQVSIASLIS